MSAVSKLLHEVIHTIYYTKIKKKMTNTVLKMNAMAGLQYLCIDQRSTEWPRGFFFILQVPVEKNYLSLLTLILSPFTRVLGIQLVIEKIVSVILWQLMWHKWLLERAWWM